jgi:hypothetical protein
MSLFATIAGALVVGCVSIVPAAAVTIAEDFSTNPLTRGWSIFGNTNLFQWDRTNQNLRVTWDSSQTNSYFHFPLGTILTRGDDFALSFNLSFSDYVSGTNPNKPFAFQAAIGFLSLAQATLTNFCRGAGVNATYGPKNLVEFDFFPALDMFQPTIAQAVVSTNNSWLYNHDNLLDLTPGQLFQVVMMYTASGRTLVTTVTNNGAQYGPTQVITVPTNSDFRVSSFSISSYSELRADGSILAHGTVDNIILNVPPPPVLNFTGAFSNGSWCAQFLSRSNWIYTLEKSLDFQSWTNASTSLLGNATNLTLLDSGPPAGRAWYRVRATRP